MTHNNAKNEGFKEDTNRSNESFGIEEIFEEFGIIPKLESRNVSSAGDAQPEIVYNNKTNRYDQK